MPAGTAADAEKFEKLHRELVADPALQFTFEAATPPPKPPDWLEPLLRFLEAIAPFLTYVFYAGIAVVVGLILYAIAREFLRHLPATQVDAKADDLIPVPEYRPAASRARDP